MTFPLSLITAPQHHFFLLSHPPVSSGMLSVRPPLLIQVSKFPEKFPAQPVSQCSWQFKQTTP